MTQQIHFPMPLHPSAASATNVWETLHSRPLKEIQSTWLLSRRIVKNLLQFWLFSRHEQNPVPRIGTQFMKIYGSCRMTILEIFVTCHTDGRQ